MSKRTNGKKGNRVTNRKTAKECPCKVRGGSIHGAGTYEATFSRIRKARKIIYEAHIRRNQRREQRRVNHEALQQSQVSKNEIYRRGIQ